MRCHLNMTGWRFALWPYRRCDLHSVNRYQITEPVAPLQPLFFHVNQLREGPGVCTYVCVFKGSLSKDTWCTFDIHQQVYVCDPGFIEWFMTGAELTLHVWPFLHETYHCSKASCTGRALCCLMQRDWLFSDTPDQWVWKWTSRQSTENGLHVNTFTGAL